MNKNSESASEMNQFLKSGGVIWHRLHSEREDVCDAILADCKVMRGVDCGIDGPRSLATGNWHRELLQARLRKIDDALDRLISGRFGRCIACGVHIEQSKLEFDPAVAFCPGCWEKELKNTCLLDVRDVNVMSSPDEDIVSNPSELVIETMRPFDTILVKTLNSEYRILLLDPKKGRVLVEGGSYFREPTEALLTGCTLHGSQFRPGAIDVGYHLEMWVDKRVVRTSKIEAITVEHNEFAYSKTDISRVMH